jgi:Reverse transcriptase (RNA-dependent DNA polymerase)
MFPDQTDLIQAYLQCLMREQVFIQLPAFWASHLPEHYRKYCGVPLRLLRALYGYTYSGKHLYEDQAKFLTQQGLIQSPILGIWYRHLPKSGLLLVLLFADNFLTACTNTDAHNEFRTALQARFQVQTQPRASWYLQAHIQQDSQGNITVDQTCYSKAIWQCYIPNADSEPTAADLKRYRQPVPFDYKWKKDDNAESMEESQNLAKEFGFTFIDL